MAVDVDRHPIAWREAGPPTGHLAGLLHGFGGSRAAWEPQLDALAEAGFRAAAWDMPGCGASDAIEVLSFPQLADAVAGWLEEIGTSAHLVGHCFGGMVALHVAVRHPSLVRSLTLAATAPAFATEGSSDWHGWMSAHADSRGFAAAMLCLPTHDVRDQLPDIRCPTLVIIGDRDRATPMTAARELVDTIPGARLVVIPDCGHVPNLEQPAEFDAALLDHLRAAP